MALYYQPSSPFCTRLPHDVLLDIALELANVDILGPPRHLPPLLRVCRYISDILNAHRKTLFARIFRAKFDTRAPLRRLGPAAVTNSALAFQLKKQTLALKRLKQANLASENLLSDLWTAYIMFLENDGRNYAHLIEYAHLDSLLDRFMDSRLWAHRQRLGTGWPLEITPNALVIWLLWYTMTPERMQAIILDRRDRFMDLLRPFAIAPLQYSTFHAPDNHFDFPIDIALRDAADFPQGTALAFYPLYRDPAMVVERVIHYGREIPIMSPLLGLGAKMVFVMLAEAVPYDPPSFLPIDRAHADPSDGVRPTQADFIEWAAVKGVQFYKPGSWDWLDALTPEQRRLEDDSAWRKELKSISSKFDNDWNRLTGCLDPYRDLPLKGVVYTFGSIVGMFAGRMQIPDLFSYRDMVDETNMPELAALPSIAEVPVYVRFREHHCINPEVPVPTGGTQHGFDDGVLNAYLPRSFEYLHAGNALRISIPGSQVTARYEDYIEGRPNSHNPAKCRACVFRAEQDELDRSRLAARARGEPWEQDAEMVDEFATDTEDESEDDDRSDQSSTGSSDSQLSYFYGDADDPLSSRELMLDHDPETEALLDEMMGDSPHNDYDEYIENECNGIQDIIITGETLPRHGEAWHHFRFYGRVRKWDGLIVLVRVPTYYPAVGKTIFRGYLVGNRNFVGSWRSYAENIHATPLEGPFALSRIDERAAVATSSSTPAAFCSSPAETAA